MLILCQHNLLPLIKSLLVSQLCQTPLHCLYCPAGHHHPVGADHQAAPTGHALALAPMAPLVVTTEVGRHLGKAAPADHDLLASGATHNTASAHAATAAATAGAEVAAGGATGPAAEAGAGDQLHHSEARRR